MTFLLTEDQEMLRDTAMAFARDELPVTRLRKLRDSGANGVDQARVWNPADRTKTTIREQTEDGTQHLYVTNQLDGGGYQTNMQQSVNQERDTTNRMHYGNAIGEGQAMSQESAYRQRNNNFRVIGIVIDFINNNTLSIESFLSLFLSALSISIMYIYYVKTARRGQTIVPRSQLKLYTQQNMSRI